MALKKKNAEYREELKLLSSQLDSVLSKKDEGKAPNVVSKDKNIEYLLKKVNILEREIKTLRSNSPRNIVAERLGLEETLKDLQEQVKFAQSKNKELMHKIDEKSKKLTETSPKNIDKQFAELRSISERRNAIEKKYYQQKEVHQKNLEKIQKLEAKCEKANELHVDYLKISVHSDINIVEVVEGLKTQINELEQRKKIIESLFKQDYDKILQEIQANSLVIEALQKELKNKTHEVNAKESEINMLKRQVRSNSVKRFAISPDIKLEGEDDFPQPIPEKKEKKSKLFSVKSVKTIVNKRPPRPLSTSPVVQKISSSSTRNL